MSRSGFLEGLWPNVAADVSVRQGRGWARLAASCLRNRLRALRLLAAIIALCQLYPMPLLEAARAEADSVEFESELPPLHTWRTLPSATLGDGLGPATITGQNIDQTLVRGAVVQNSEECRYDPAPLQLPNMPDAGEANYLHTCGNRIYDHQGRGFTFIGVNWFGLETVAYAPRGLETRNWQDILDEIVEKGYNTIRLPFSTEVLAYSGHSTGIDYDLNPDLEGLSTLELMDTIVQGARTRGLRIILDRHRLTSQKQSPLWYTVDVSEQRWIDDWVMLARRYFGNDTVVAFDLHNEPQMEATWGTGDFETDWRLAAERAGDAVLAANPYLLIFVQGITIYEEDYYWWGAQLRPAAEFPVRLGVPNRLVYSPRDYGPEVYEQPYFRDVSFPANMPAIWDEHWGYLHKEGIAPIVLGEFDGPSLDDDLSGQWQRALLRYLFLNRIGFVVWQLDDDVWLERGRLRNQWASFLQQSHNLAKGYLVPPSFGGAVSRITKDLLTVQTASPTGPGSNEP